MDEQKKARVVELVRSMMKEGTPGSEIRSTLHDFGLDEIDVENIMTSVSAQPTHTDIKEAVSEIQAVVKNQPTVEHMMENTAKTEEVRQRVDDLHETASASNEKLDELNAFLGEHGEKLEGVHSAVSELSAKHDVLSEGLSEVMLLKSDIREIREMLIELKPMVGALRDLNEKILSTNQQFLMRIKKE